MKPVACIASLLILSIALLSPASSAQSLRERWSQPVDPYRVISNIFYVGASGISSHVIETSEGLILVDTGTTLMVPQIQSNIEKLGFNIRDVKIIVSSHAHWDHVEGHADMKRRTGAEIAAVGLDAEAIDTGVDNSALGAEGWEPAKVDRVLNDGDIITLGDVTMKALLTPGHTRGCTTWTMTVTDQGKSLNVVFIGGTSVNAGVNLIGNTRHPEIKEDYATTFRILKALNVDVFLAQHPSMHSMSEKMRKLRSGSGTNPFIDPEGYRTYIQGEENKYLKRLEQELAAR